MGGKRKNSRALYIRAIRATCRGVDLLSTDMKFVAIIDGKKKGEDRITSFIYPDDGPVPPIVDPEKPEEAKDGGAPGPSVKNPKEHKPS